MPLSDIADGFVKADVITPDDYLKHGSEDAVREAGLFRTEGKEYIVKDGDIMLFKFHKKK